MLGDDTTRDKLWRIAARQRGYFTAAQALKAGYSYQAQHFHVGRQNWIRIDRGIYRFREYLELPSADTDHLVRWSLWSRDRAVMSHTTALAVHDLGIANPAEIHLTVPPGFRAKDSAVVLHRANLAAADIEQHEGFRVTTPLRAIAESAAAAVDQDLVDSAVADALFRGLTSRRRLLHAAQELGARAELGVERALREAAE
ncbi:type IV toxin-antitoxin system AbiEi family antitoxin domain-containing protein [Streptomyces albus]|uniref:type IV toxin-antitoxin system AbiEi family antitoxin domain-containing protein n=1 Tax=Streptomyces albus TaxID=1888 RepID=UPI003F1B1FDC